MLPLLVLIIKGDVNSDILHYCKFLEITSAGGGKREAVNVKYSVYNGYWARKTLKTISSCDITTCCYLSKKIILHIIRIIKQRVIVILSIRNNNDVCMCFLFFFFKVLTVANNCTIPI